MADFKTPSAIDVAKFLLGLAIEDKKELTQKSLQKLLYYVQGYSLGLRDREVFKEAIRAWREGPVVREVYDFFKSVPLTETLVRHAPNVSSVHDLDTLDRAFIAAIWDDFKECSERELIDRTHSETPWLQARQFVRPHEPSDVLIPNAALRDFFSQPSPHAISRGELRAIAACPKSRPPDSWLDEPDPTED